MAEGAGPALGLSIGSTNLAAVTADLAITRKPVLTLFRRRSPEVGVPAENPKLDERGLVITDFVDRVGDPVVIEAVDGSVHRSEVLAAEALRALAYTATGGRPLPDSVAITYPAHWERRAVDELGSALSRVSEWSNRARPLTLIPDATAALFAVRANPGLPDTGIVAVCDFGGSGTSVTVVDAAGEYQPVGTTGRYLDFSGDLLDQVMLTAVLANLPGTGVSGPGVPRLARLRAECRTAKEQLSAATVTTLLDVQITRAELRDAIGDSLANFLAFVETRLRYNGIRDSDLAAMVLIGGGASLPAVTAVLSRRFRVPVVTTPRPHLAAAVGGALRASRDVNDAGVIPVRPAALAR